MAFPGSPRRLCRPGTPVRRSRTFLPARAVPHRALRPRRLPALPASHRPALHRAARPPHHPALRAPHTIPHCAQKAPGAFAPGAGCYGAAVPAHAPMSWQERMMMVAVCARVALPFGSR